MNQDKNNTTPPLSKEIKKIKTPPIVTPPAVSPTTITPPTDGQKVVTKISELQRMNVEELYQYGKSINVKNLGSQPKTQVVFEIVKAISFMPR